METPDVIRAVTRINAPRTEATSRLPAGAWVDRTIRHL